MINLSTKPAAARGDKAESNKNARSAAATGQSLGSLLRERREAMGASLAEVETATKIRQKYLSAIESDEWPQLPGEVVGRGFLRNYATYLGLDGTEMIERRRAIADPKLSNALADTSAGSALPPMREIDYRPKDVGLRDEPQGIEERPPVRLGPFLAVVSAVALLAALWWAYTNYGNEISRTAADVAESVQTRIAGFFAAPPPTPTLPAVTPVVNGANVNAQGVVSATVTVTGSAVLTPAAAEVPLEPTATETPGFTLPTPTPRAEGAAPEAVPTPLPSPTPVPAPPAQPAIVGTAANLRGAPGLDAPVVGAANVGQEIRITGQSADGLWFQLEGGAWIFAQLVQNPPTNVPVAVPGAETTPAASEAAAQAVAPALCADPRVQIASPGQGQVVSGVVSVSGTATHEAFALFKLEVAAGDAAGGGFVSIASSNTPVTAGVLGNFDTALVANGPYTVRLTVLDQAGNAPPACDVTVTVQN